MEPIKIWDDTCRGHDAGRIVEFIEDSGNPQDIGSIGRKINRGSVYVRRLAENTPELTVLSRSRLVRDWTVGLSAKEKRDGG